jgi:hypothetical protein
LVEPQAWSAVYTRLGMGAAHSRAESTLDARRHDAGEGLVASQATIQARVRLNQPVAASRAEHHDDRFGLVEIIVF